MPKRRKELSPVELGNLWDTDSEENRMKVASILATSGHDPALIILTTGRIARTWGFNGVQELEDMVEQISQ